jgi:NUMOD4 motif/HNH endonuclease
MEIWKDVVGYEGLYMVSNKGRMKSLNRFRADGISVKGRVLKLQTCKDGYYKLNLSKDGKKKTFRVNRLVALSFIDNPLDLPVVNHKDGDKKNNEVVNLEWCTVSENTKHGFDKLGRVGNNGGMNKVVSQLDKSSNHIIKTFNSIHEASREIGVTVQAISGCLNGRSETSGGFKWAFANEGVTTIESTNT